MIKRENKKNLIALVVAAIVLACGVIGMNVAEHRGGDSQATDTSTEIHEINGIQCTKKQNIEAYLFMGTDREGGNGIPVQSDTNILLVIDRVNDTYSILHLDRDAMVTFEVPDKDGQVAGEKRLQLALTYAYGDGEDTSCESTENAVSRLLADQRINGYVSMDVNSIGDINNILGGVDVTIDDDFGPDSELVKGAAVHLTDQQAVEFVRGRHGVADGTNENRMKRQRQYLDAALPVFKEKCREDSGFVDDAVDRLQGGMVTDMTNAQFSKVAKAIVKDEEVAAPEIKYTRTINDSTGFAEVVYDEESLNLAIISLFYEPTEEYREYFDMLVEEAK